MLALTGSPSKPLKFFYLSSYRGELLQQRVTHLWINWRQALLTKTVRNCICQQNRLMCLLGQVGPLWSHLSRANIKSFKYSFLGKYLSTLASTGNEYKHSAGDILICYTCVQDQCDPGALLHLWVSSSVHVAKLGWYWFSSPHPNRGHITDNLAHNF